MKVTKQYLWLILIIPLIILVLAVFGNTDQIIQGIIKGWNAFK